MIRYIVFSIKDQRYDNKSTNHLLQVSRNNYNAINMKIFIILAAVVAACVAAPSHLLYSAVPTLYHSVLPVETSSQYHAQDTLGQYSYGYKTPLSSVAESRTLDGITHGGYSYIDADHKLQTVSYTADAKHGFRVAGTNLPVAPEVPKVELREALKPVEDTFEVAKAKAEHFIAHEEAKKSSDIYDAVEIRAAVKPISKVAKIHDLLKPVEDTFEVAKAKAEHFVAHEEAKKRSEFADAVEIHAAVAPIIHHPIAYSVPVAAPAVTVHYEAPKISSYSYAVKNFHHPGFVTRIGW